MKLIPAFVLSATDPAHFPAPGPPEIAFLGRSNVGKSSLINSLVGEKIAKTSNTPGRTRAINFFAIRRPGQPKPDLLFADLPGYGYAKVSREVSAEWPKFINPYLETRPTLALCLCLIDANVPAQASDLQLIEFLKNVGRRFLLVATKADRLSGNKLRASMEALSTEFQTDKILPFSSKNTTGRDELWRRVRESAGYLGGMEKVG